MTETKSYAEQSLIGCLAIEPALAGQIFRAVGAEDFSGGVWRTLFEAARAIWVEGGALDAVTMCDRAGGAAYKEPLAEAMRLTPTTANWESWAAIIKNERQLRELRELAGEILGCSRAEDAREVLRRMQGLLVDRQRSRTVPLQAAIMDLMDELDRLSGRKVEYLDWGLPFLTDYLDTEPGDFVVLGGYPSAGKTLLALQMAAVIARRKRVGFFSLETGTRKLTRRLLSHQSGVELQKLKHADLTESDWRKLSSAAESLYNLPFTVEECAGDDVDEIALKVMAGRYQVIFVDYLQLINERGSSRYEIVTEISRKLHTLAREHGVVICALAQLQRPDNRDGKPVPPSMSSLRESGQIEQDADAVLLLYPENPNQRGSDRFLKIAKNKENDAVPPARLTFQGATQTFIEQFPERPRSQKTQTKRKDRDRMEQEELPL